MKEENERQQEDAWNGWNGEVKKRGLLMGVGGRGEDSHSHLFSVLLGTYCLSFSQMTRLSSFKDLATCCI